ncbi:MAG TPA: preprotein translocase subunit SecE [Chloroflexota bacterium]|nr:preprotein translocase subunit SecE [Chloroflexota bacterium]
MAKQVTGQTAVPVRPGGGRRAVISPAQYFQESRAELRKVNWPSREETTQLTFAVIAMTLAIAIFLGVIDQLLNWVIAPLSGLK